MGNFSALHNWKCYICGGPLRPNCFGPNSQVVECRGTCRGFFGYSNMKDGLAGIPKNESSLLERLEQLEQGTAHIVRVTDPAT